MEWFGFWGALIVLALLFSLIAGILALAAVVLGAQREQQANERGTRGHSYKRRKQ